MLAAAVLLASSITFKFDFYGCQTMTPVAISSATQLARVLETPSLRDKRFTVEGNSSKTGDRAAEQAISQQLAQDVADRLISYGVDSRRLAVRGLGAERPLLTDLPEDYDNCRVDIIAQ